MHTAHQSEKRFILVFKKGDHYHDSLMQFIKETGIGSALFSGIGGFLKAELSYYDLESQEYIDKSFDDGPYEVASLTGNISEKDGSPVIHNHVVLGDKQYKAIAGHLKDAVVGGTLELEIRLIGKEMLTRETNKETGLDLLISE